VNGVFFSNLLVDFFLDAKNFPLFFPKNRNEFFYGSLFFNDLSRWHRSC
jgi:hypothetical protein